MNCPEPISESVSCPAGSTPRYADVVLPLAQPLYTYAVPEGMAVEEGMAVAASLGPSKIYTAIVWRLHDERPRYKTVKPLLRTLYGSRVVVDASQRAFWEWIADYYLCTLGEVMGVALPALMKPSGRGEEAFAEEEYRPQRERMVLLASALRDPAQLEEALATLRRAKRQAEALREVAGRTMARVEAGDSAEMPLKSLEANPHHIRSLAERGWLTLTEREVSARRVTHPADFDLPTLSAAQQRALEEIRAGFEHRSTVLLHGITGSGKTELYMHLMAEVLAAGDDVLLLLPEIALTAQLIARLRRLFGERVTAYHSQLTDRRRMETYLRLDRSGGGNLVVGARSALFLPLRRLRLLVVDEEHDAGYKQSEPAPRYQARDCAVMLAHRSGCRTLLGSATPSLESYLNARTGKYGLVQLLERYGASVPPTVILSDTVRAVKRGERRTHFNFALLERMRSTLDSDGQVMLFQNRRGFSPWIECGCGWAPRCPHCNVTLTQHRSEGRMVCHYCGYNAPIPDRCPRCGAQELRPMGFGTEKVEQEVTRLFPEARVARLDRDSVTSERAFREIVERFERGESDVLVGTQMITKGFDFGGVALVGILNADNLLHNPDFRAAERAFQLMTQVAGRAGRREVPGEVVIQTSEPDHPVVRQAAAGDYEAMARCELAERKAFFYPPYARLVALTLRHRDVQLVRRAANALAVALRSRFGGRVLGPTTPPVDRVRDQYLVDLLLKVEAGASFARAREVVRRTLEEVIRAPKSEFRSVFVLCDVDPQ